MGFFFCYPSKASCPSRLTFKWGNINRKGGNNGGNIRRSDYYQACNGEV
jgi:hypothetical protein